MATELQQKPITAAMKQHVDSGGRDVLIVKDVELGAKLQHSGDLPFWTTDLYTAPAPDENDPAGEPVVVCSFDYSRLKISRRRAPMPYTWRHIDADELHFVHRGHAKVLTELGSFDAPAGRFIFINRGIGYRIEPQTDDFMSVIFESEQHITLEDDVNKAGIPIIYPDFPCALDSPGATEFEERLRTQSWGISVMRPTDPLQTIETDRDEHPTFALDIDTIPAHQPTSPKGVLPFIIFRGSSFHLEVAMPKTPMPFFHRNVRANETVFAHSGNGDRESLLGHVSTPMGSLTNYPKGIDHRVGDRGGASTCLIWETNGNVELTQGLVRT